MPSHEEEQLEDHHVTLQVFFLRSPLFYVCYLCYIYEVGWRQTEPRNELGTTDIFIGKAWLKILRIYYLCT
jgi:hypothetical protein